LLDSEIDEAIFDLYIKKYNPHYVWLPEASKIPMSRFLTIYSEYGYVLMENSESNNYRINDDLALLLTTSGSVGSPKLVRLSYENISSNMKSIAHYLKISNGDRSITTLPMNYSFGLSIINSYLHCGASLVLTQKSIMQKDFWDQLRLNNVTSLSGVPYTFEMLNRLKITDTDLPSLRVITQAGGRLSNALQRKFAEYAIVNNIRFFVMYGQTEATARMSYLELNKSIEKCGSIGQAIPGGKFKISFDMGNENFPNEDAGDLIYQGNNVMLGYANSWEDLAKSDECHGNLITGDIAKVDSEGYIYIVGRKSRFLKLFGNRISLDEVEQILINNFPGIEFACKGDDSQLITFIAGRYNSKEIIQYLAERIGLHHSVFKVVEINQMPKTSSGKIKYLELPISE
jgi:acyl-coenzyme A synthetase/AMP-(fatty) acid ligase